MMKEISRREVQNLLAKSTVVRTSTARKNGELEVAFFLSDNGCFIVRYSSKHQRKRYFLKMQSQSWRQ
ncbi:MAG: hypothetical protein ACOY90_09900 [Candidatus Zhuqueibacterota bacterium]